MPANEFMCREKEQCNPENVNICRCCQLHPEEQRSHLKRLWNGRQCSSSTRSTLHVVIAGSDTVEGCLIVGLLKVIGPPSLVHFVCEAFCDVALVFDLGA